MGNIKIDNQIKHNKFKLFLIWNSFMISNAFLFFQGDRAFSQGVSPN